MDSDILISGWTSVEIGKISRLPHELCMRYMKFYALEFPKIEG
jgi:hypothetical protein